MDRAETGRSNRTPFFDGLIFHRIIPDFMIQGGCPLGHGHRRPRLHLRRRDQPGHELHRALHARHGQRRQARGKGTNGSQFFITVGNTSWLQGKHTIFGEVADAPSREVVDAIAGVRTGANDKPVEDVVIESVVVNG